MQKVSVPGFTIKKTRLGAKREANRSIESSPRSGQRSARSVETNDSRDDSSRKDLNDASASLMTQEKAKGWLELEKAKEEHRVEQEEKEKRMTARKMALKISKSAIEKEEACKAITNLACRTESSLNSGIDLSKSSLQKLVISDEDESHDQAQRYFDSGKYDLMASMQWLSSTTMKICFQKQKLEDFITKVQSQYVIERKKFQESIAEVALQLDNLRIEKENAHLQLTDVESTYVLQIKTLQRESEEAKQALKILEAVNKKLNITIFEQENELYQVPRLEESYLRSARGLVVQKERIVQEKKIQLKRVEKDVEKTEYWHQKSLALQEENRKKLHEIADLKRQLTIATSKYFNTIGIGKPKEWKKQASNHDDRTGEVELLLEGEDGSGSNHNHNHIKKATTIITSKSKSQVKNDKSNANDDDDFDFNVFEIARLKESNKKLLDRNDHLSSALANARAYPLFHTTTVEDSNSHSQSHGDDDNHHEPGKKNHQELLDDLFDSDEDREDINTGIVTEEDVRNDDKEKKEAQYRRIERALDISAVYKKKLANLRASRPGVAHIKSLRA